MQSDTRAFRHPLLGYKTLWFQSISVSSDKTCVFFPDPFVGRIRQVPLFIAPMFSLNYAVIVCPDSFRTVNCNFWL